MRETRARLDTPHESSVEALHLLLKALHSHHEVTAHTSGGFFFEFGESSFDEFESGIPEAFIDEIAGLIAVLSAPASHVIEDLQLGLELGLIF